MIPMDEVRKAVKRCVGYGRVYPKDISTLVSLAQSVLDAEWPKYRKIRIDSIRNEREDVVFNKAIDACQLFLTKKCLEYEQRIKELEAQNGHRRLYEKYRNRRGRGVGWGKRIEIYITAIRELIEKEMR